MDNNNDPLHQGVAFTTSQKAYKILVVDAGVPKPEHPKQLERNARLCGTSEQESNGR